MSGRLPIPHPLAHAYVIAGGGEQSRRAYALRLAQAFLCRAEDAPCGRCRDCEKVLSGVHPDLRVLAPAEGKKEISVAEARALRADVYVLPNEAARKVCLIDPADALNPAAQNVLLKVVEEGPPYAAFILSARRPGALLETLLSRCETVALPPEEDVPDEKQLAQAENLAGLLLDGDELALASFLAGLENAKLKSGDVLDLFALTEASLARRLADRPAQAAPLLKRLRTFRDLRPYNVGAGHLLGALGTGLEWKI